MDRTEANLIKVIETTYIQHIKDDYVLWNKSDSYDRQLGVSYTIGRTYIKITCGNTVHSFIVLKPTKGFEVGDILKTASWYAPATNFKRGNVFDTHTYANVRWTGVM